MALEGEQRDLEDSRLTSFVGRLGAASRSFLNRFDISKFPLPQGLRAFIKSCGRDGEVRKAFTGWVNRQPLTRFISASLFRRIMISNMIGFIVMFLGILYLSFNSGWVINEKSQALRVQGQIIAAAIANDAKRRRAARNRTTRGNGRPKVPFRDDGFAALELSLRPERVAPILRRLIEPINTRARIYDRNGNLIVDSAKILKSGQIGVAARREKVSDKPKTKNFWTRLQYWIINKEVPVYKEIGSANGKYYPEVRSALKGKADNLLLLNDRGEQIVSMAVPIRRRTRPKATNANVLGALLLSTRPGEVDEILADEREAIWPLALMALLVSVATAWVLTRTVADPMKRLSDTAELVTQDINARHHLPANVDRKDEVGQMAKAFRSMTNALFRRIDASEKFAADVAHELKNPLTAASSTAQALEYAKTEQERDSLVEQIQGELKRLNRLITDVSSVSRLDAELARQPQVPVDMQQVLANVMMIFADRATSQDCTLSLDIQKLDRPGAYVVKGNEGRLAQVITNLVDNALSFSPKGARVKIKARRVADQVEIAIEDEGPGIEEDKLETIFSRFYTYRPTETTSRGDNSGLGLSISREIVRALGGELWAENRRAPEKKRARQSNQPRAKKQRTTVRGSRFTVRLPFHKPSPNTS